MAGLSVASTRRCEEMWLAWAHGACLVPAPRSLVRSGMDLGPWLVANDITVVSTVPTLVALWPTEALADVRLLILGGEACPPEIGARLATPEREVWNTYGPTEATVVACAARLTGTPPVRIGLPLDGWDLAVVDAHGSPVGARRAGGADHRWRRPGAVPGPGQGRREVRRHADAGLGPGLPQRRPRARRPRGPGLHRPRRRPGQDRRPADRARRDRQRPARRPRCDGRGRGRAELELRQQAAGRVRRGRRHLRPDVAMARLRSALPASLGAAAGPRRRTCRRRRPGRSTATPCPGRSRPSRRGESAPAARAPPAGCRTSGATSSAPSATARRRLLRPRRRQPDGRPARGPAPRALPRGHRRRRLRAPTARRPRRRRST